MIVLLLQPFEVPPVLTESTCTCQDCNQLLQFLLKLPGHPDNIKARYEKSSSCAFLSTSGPPEDRCGPLDFRFLLLIQICSPAWPGLPPSSEHAIYN